MKNAIFLLFKGLAIDILLYSGYKFKLVNKIAPAIYIHFIADKRLALGPSTPKTIVYAGNQKSRTGKDQTTNSDLVNYSK